MSSSPDVSRLCLLFGDQIENIFREQKWHSDFGHAEREWSEKNLISGVNFFN